jgi:Hemerythrin HHE cation binding domain
MGSEHNAVRARDVPVNRTDRYRRQHAEIMQLATELGKQLDPSALAANASEARRILSDLSGKLIVHLAAEDTLLYPQLLTCRDQVTQKVAQQFTADMAPISKAFKDYALRWASAGEIQSRADAFVWETRNIIDALAQRIRRENTELYPLADRI